MSRSPNGRVDNQEYIGEYRRRNRDIRNSYDEEKELMDKYENK